MSSDPDPAADEDELEADVADALLVEADTARTAKLVKAPAASISLDLLGTGTFCCRVYLALWVRASFSS